MVHGHGGLACATALDTFAYAMDSGAFMGGDGSGGALGVGKPGRHRGPAGRPVGRLPLRSPLCGGARRMLLLTFEGFCEDEVK